MHKKRKRTQQQSSPSQGRRPERKEILGDILRGLLIGVAVFAVLTVICSVLLMKISMGEIETAVLFLFCCCVSAAVGGFFCARRPKKNGILLGLAGCAPLMVIVLLAALLINGGKAGTNIAIMVPLMVIFGICGGVLAVNMKKRVK